MEVLQRTANRGSISTGFDIDNSIKLEPDNSEFFNKTFGSAGNRKTWSYSCWIKKTELFSSNGGALISAYPDVNNRLKIAFSQYKIQVFGKVGGSTTVNVRTNRLYRDTSAFYHILVVFDTTQGTAANRVKIYTNGVLEDSFDQTTYPSQNNDEEIGNSSAHYIGQRGDGSSDFYAGYITEINYVNGQALAPTDFGEYDEDSGIWKPKAYAGSYGTNGFYLNFDDSASLGADSSGNSNTFTLNNIAAADQATDTPTNNFCTWLPLWTYTNMATIGNGGTSSIGGGGSVWRGAKGSMGVSKGKWYWEQKASGNDTIVGWQTDNCISDSGSNSHNVLDTISFYEGGNFLWIKDSTSGRNAASASGTYANGQIVGCALNLDSDPQTVTFYRNGSAIISDRNIDGLANKTLFPQTSHYNQTSDANFGGYTNFTISSAASDANGYGTFEYAPPSGYYALCTKNLAEYG